MPQSPEQTPVKLFVEDDSLTPSRGTEFSAGYDLRAKQDYVVEVGKTTYIGTGVFIELQPGFEVQIRPRSGLSTKQGLIIPNAPGTIDSDYRNEILVGMTLLEGYQKGNKYFILKGDKIAQMVISRYLDMDCIRVTSTDDLSKTVRARGGFNSTGR